MKNTDASKILNKVPVLIDHPSRQQAPREVQRP
jgi:hypothetical protein